MTISLLEEKLNSTTGSQGSKLYCCFVQLIPISVPFIPPSCHRYYENPQARLYPHITLHSESSAARFGTAFILVSHVEATQAAGRARRDMREFYS